MTSEIRVGVLGFAHGHVNAYCGRWREEPAMGVKVTAGWDHQADRLKAAADSYGLVPCSSEKQLLARDDVDAVMIASETALHAGLVEMAAAAGKTVILQKPLCLTTEEADRIVSAVKRSGIRFTLAWQMRVDPQNCEMKQLLADGSFGHVTMLRRRHCLSTHKWKDFDKTWHVSAAMNRDIFADDAAHAVDFMYWMLGKPCSVMTELGTLRNPRIPNDHAIAVFRYKDGAFAEIVCSFAASGGENCAEIQCENGIIILNHGDGPSCELPWPDGAIQLKWRLDSEPKWVASALPPVRGQWNRIQALSEPLAEFLHGRRPPIGTAEEGRDVLRLILACYDSSSQGKRISV